MSCLSVTVKQHLSGRAQSEMENEMLNLLPAAQGVKSKTLLLWFFFFHTNERPWQLREVSLREPRLLAATGNSKVHSSSSCSWLHARWWSSTIGKSRTHTPSALTPTDQVSTTGENNKRAASVVSLCCHCPLLIKQPGAAQRGQHM